MYAPLAQPAFRYLFAAQTTSMVGTTLSPVALSLGVLSATGSATSLGFVLAAYSGSLTVFLLIGGVWADRVSRAALMRLSDSIRAVAQMMLGVLLLTGAAELWSMMLLQGITGIATAFYFPAATGLTAATVEPSQLQRANALLRLAKNVSGVGGPVIGATLVVTAGAGWAMVVDGVSFAASAILLGHIRLPVIPVRRAAETNVVRDVAAGWREVWHRPWVLGSIANFAMYNLLFATVLVLGPAMLLARPHGEFSWGGVIAVFSAGQILGSIIALRVEPRRPMLTSRLVESLGVPFFLSLAFEFPMPWLLVLAALAGLSTSYPDAVWLATLQRHVPAEKISRVSSFDWLGSLLFAPIGLASAAFVAAHAGTTVTLAVAGTLLGVVRLGSLLIPDMRSLRTVPAAAGSERGTREAAIEGEGTADRSPTRSA